MAKESLYSNLVQEFYRIDGEITRLQQEKTNTNTLLFREQPLADVLKGGLSIMKMIVNAL